MTVPRPTLLFIKVRMFLLNFLSIRYQNFISSGASAIAINLAASHLNLIAGKNGCGKSTITDAFCFALYGKPYRNINKNQLINSINGKKCLVEVEFEVGKKKYRVVRGMKPTVFEIYEDEVLLNQNPNIRDHQKLLETQILKMNYRAFTQVVIMGSGAYIPFMELVPAHRRDFIEDLLDIRIFSVMNMVLKDKLKLSNDTLKEIGIDIKNLKSKAELQQAFIEKQKKEKGESIQQLENDIAIIQEENKTHQNTVDDLLSGISTLQTQADENDAHEQLAELKALTRKRTAEYNNELEQISFYETTESCPTCKQSIEDGHRHAIVKDAASRASLIEQDLELSEGLLIVINSKLAKHEELSVFIADYNSQVGELNKKIHANNTLISSYNTRIDAVRGDTTSIDEEMDKLKAFAKEIVALDKQKKILLEELQFQQAASMLLQDTGIKSKIIKQYVPVINKLVNRYLGKLDFFCQFHLDENFTESVKSRYRDDFSYHSFSEGQKLRIDLALIFTWREIARMKNSVTTNLVIFDELFDSSMDGAGMDLALGLLDDLVDSNVFVISHREGSFDKFPNVIQMEMKNNFTVVL